MVDATKIGLRQVCDLNGQIDDCDESSNPNGPLWPEPLGEAAYHGPVGDLVQAIEPHSEADPAALLVQALVALVLQR